MAITYREVREWPGPKTPSYRRTRAPFKAHATRLWDLLERELQRVSARDVVLYGYWRARDFRRDGGVYADARPTEPGVVLEFLRGKDRMRFACDRFPVWLDNVDAIARSLEALRMIDRYGVTSGQQYEGFRALPSPAAQGFDSREAALAFLREVSGVVLDWPIDPDALKQAERVAKSRTHPDHGGDPALFHRVVRAVELLDGAA